jgi:hypothetical protein
MVNDNSYIGDTASDNTSTTQAEAPVSYVVDTPTPPIDNDGYRVPGRSADVVSPSEISVIDGSMGTQRKAETRCTPECETAPLAGWPRIKPRDTA